MPKLHAFSESGYSGSSQEFRSNDPDLTLNGGGFVPRATIVHSDRGSLDDDMNSSRNSIFLRE